jgi:hypothetical protein
MWFFCNAFDFFQMSHAMARIGRLDKEIRERTGAIMSTIGQRPNSSFLGGVPTYCAHCKHPFPSVNGRFEAWRSSTGKYFCNEFCAEDDEEASFRFHRPLPARPLLQHCRGWGGR